MSKQQQTPNPQEKGKKPDCPPSCIDITPNLLPTLEQLKSNIESATGVVKNATEARDLLEKKQWLLPNQKIMYTQLSTVLFSIVATHGPRKSIDKPSEATANVIKAVAFLLEEATVAVYVEKILQQLSNHQASHDTSQNKTVTTSQTHDAIQNLSDMVTKQTDSLQRNSDILEKIQQTQTNQNNEINPQGNQHTLHNTYRDALINGQANNLQLTTIKEAKIQNRLNISACQTLVEVQTENDRFLKDAFPSEENPIGKIKNTINQWLANADGDTLPPEKSSIRAITKYRKNKLLIETNTREATAWFKQNSDHFLKTLLGHPVKILGRLHPVIA
jgi:hypothetical protein